MRLRFVATLAPPVQGFGPRAAGEEISFLPLDRIWADDRFDPSQTIEFDGDVRSYNPVNEGDLLVPKVSPTFAHGRTAIATELTGGRALATSEVFVLRAHDEAGTRFLKYRLIAPDFLAAGQSSWTGVAGLKRISGDFLLNTHIDERAWAARAAVAGFLDRELDRIQTALAALAVEDVLFTRRERLLDELLFGPPGGDDAWFGRLPSGWSCRPLKSLADGYPPMFTDGDWIESPFITGEGIRLIQTGNIGRGHFIDQGFRYISPATFDALVCTEVLPGDILLSRLSPPVGRACIAPTLDVPMISSVDVAILRLRPEVEPEWIVALCSSDRYLTELQLMSRGSTMQRVSRSQLGNVPVPVPPSGLQRRVAQAWVDETQRERTAIEAARRMSGVLTDYRDSLIHEAVTGKIDVSRVSENQMQERLHAATEGRLDKVPA